MNDEELTRLAVAEILREAELFQKKNEAEFRALRAKSPVKVTPNTNFLKRTIRDTLFSNKLVTDKHTFNKRNNIENASFASHKQSRKSSRYSQHHTRRASSSSERDRSRSRTRTSMSHSKSHRSHSKNKFDKSNKLSTSTSADVEKYSRKDTKKDHKHQSNSSKTR